MDHVSMLREMVSIDSSYPNEGEFGKHVAELMKSLGMKVKKQRVEKGRHNIIGTVGDGETEIILLGHLDTVPPAEGWDDPFFLRVSGKRAMGLGASDMKGGIVAALSSLEEYEGNAKIKLALMVDEENESLGSWKFVNSGEASGDFCISLETGMGLGPRAITLGRRGRILVKAEFASVSRHLMEGGKANAISEMAKFIDALGDLRMEIHEELGMGSAEPLKVMSEAKGLSYPEKAVVYVDRHYVPPMDEESVIEQLRELARGLDIECAFRIAPAERRTPFLKPYTTSRENPFVGKLASAVRKMFGKVYYTYARSVSDENRLSELMPTVAIGPKGGNEHSAGEWVDLKSLDDLASVLREFYRIL